MASSQIDDILAEVDAWFAQEMQRAPISYDTGCYNQAYAAHQSLRDRLTAVITGEPVVVAEPASNAPQQASGEAEAAPEAPETSAKQKSKPAA